MTDDEKEKWPLYMRFVRAFVMPALGTIGAMFFTFWLWPVISERISPATEYYELLDVVVLEAALVDDYKVLTTRVIKQPFDGSYETTIRRLDESQPICSGGKELRYQPRSDGDRTPRRVEFDLPEWTSGSIPPCVDALKRDLEERGPGTYLMTSCIRVDEGLVLNMKSVCAQTVFTYPSTTERPS